MIVWIAAALLAAQSGDFDTARHRAEALLKKGDLRAALPLLEKANRLNPADYRNGWDLALAYLETGKLSSARSQIASMIARRDTAELHNLLASAEERADNTKEAARQHQTAVHMDPSEKNLSDWGNFLLRIRAHQPALETYRSAVKMHPRSSPLHVGLGVALYSLSRYNEAVQALCDAIDLAPSDPRPIVFLGKMQDLSPALAADVGKRLEHYAKLYPRNVQANLYYGRNLLSREHWSAAEKQLNATVALDPRLAEAHFGLGTLYEQQSRLAEAIASFQEAARLEPSMEKAHFRLSRLYQRTGQPKRAREEREIYQRLHEKSVPPLR